MIPVKVTFVDGSTMRVFVRQPEAFGQQAADTCTTIHSIEELPGVELLPTDKMVECTLTLKDGIRLTCSMLEQDMDNAKAECAAVLDCEIVYTEQLLELATIETVLDERLKGAYAVINNIPNKLRRLKLHREYLKRKSGYVASLEALIDGSFSD